MYTVSQNFRLSRGVKVDWVGLIEKVIYMCVYIYLRKDYYDLTLKLWGINKAIYLPIGIPISR